jgi:hypothetical protein
MIQLRNVGAVLRASRVGWIHGLGLELVHNRTAGRFADHRAIELPHDRLRTVLTRYNRLQRCPGILTRCPRAGSCATVASGDAPGSRSTTAFQRQTSAPPRGSEALLRSASGPRAVPGRVCPNVRPTTGDRSSYASDGSPNAHALRTRHLHRRPGRAPGSRRLDRPGLTTIDPNGAVMAGAAAPSRRRGGPITGTDAEAAPGEGAASAEISGR